MHVGMKNCDLRPIYRFVRGTDKDRTIVTTELQKERVCNVLNGDGVISNELEFELHVVT